MVFDHAGVLPFGNEIIDGIAFARLDKAQVTDSAFGNSDQTFPEG